MNRSPLRILLVEDTDHTLRAVANALKERGFHVFCAMDCATAIMVLRACHGNFDALICDVNVVKGMLPEPVESHHEFPTTSLPLISVIRSKYSHISTFVYSRDSSSPAADAYREIGIKVHRVDELKRWCKEFVDHVSSQMREMTKRPTAFIVHGHNKWYLNELRSLITDEFRWNQPIVLIDSASIGDTIIEKLEEGASKTDITFVLYTGDDEFRTTSGEVVYRARPNVMFELGYFCALKRRRSGRVILLHDGKAEWFSDYSGVIPVDVSKGVRAAKAQIEKEVRAIGFVTGDGS